MHDIRSTRPSDAAIDAEFDARRRRRVFDEVLAARSRVVPITHKRSRWAGALAAAAASIAVVALVAQSLPSADGPLIARPADSTTPSATTEPTPTESSVGGLAAVAASAAAAPPVPAGSFLRMTVLETTEGEAGGGSTDDTYTDADGWTWMHRVEEIEAWTLEDRGTDVFSLPTDPAALEVWSREQDGRASGVETVYEEMVRILTTPRAPADLRSAAVHVLERISAAPSVVETAASGALYTPVVTATQGTAEDAQAWRISFTDKTSNPDLETWITLDSQGALVETGGEWADGSSRKVVVENTTVPSLPAEFVRVLGTEHVEQFYF